jgi:hypothetical protein
MPDLDKSPLTDTLFRLTGLFSTGLYNTQRQGAAQHVGHCWNPFRRPRVTAGL